MAITDRKMKADFWEYFEHETEALEENIGVGAAWWTEIESGDIYAIDSMLIYPRASFVDADIDLIVRTRDTSLIVELLHGFSDAFHEIPRIVRSTHRNKPAKRQLGGGSADLSQEITRQLDAILLKANSKIDVNFPVELASYIRSAIEFADDRRVPLIFSGVSRWKSQEDELDTAWMVNFRAPVEPSQVLELEDEIENLLDLFLASSQGVDAAEKWPDLSVSLNVLKV